MKKEKGKNEGVDYTPQFLSCDEKGMGREKGIIDCAYCCALLRSALRYQITPVKKKRFEPFIFAAGAQPEVKPATVVNTKGAEWQIPN